MNMRTDLSKKNSTKYSRQRRKKAESLKRTLVLLLATAFLLSMPLGAYMVSASDGVTPDPAAVTGTDPAVQSDPALSTTEVPVDPAPATTPVSDPVPAPDAAPVSEPTPALAAQADQSGTYIVNWLDEDGTTILGTGTFQKGVDPETVSVPEGVQTKTED